MLIMYVIINHYIEFKYLQPPPLPSNHVNRQNLLDEIASKLLQVTSGSNSYGTTLTITGAGGFGKTTSVISLCYHPIVKEYFTDGFLFIELGPQATDPSVKLSRLYHLLTGEDIKKVDINLAELEIRQITSEYYRNLLVIIDDVWHVEDAEPLVKAFLSCKTILTTRMNDIEQYIPCKESITIGPMAQNEAISLLTSGVIESSQLSQEDVSLLDELAQDVHLWPLLLSLIRGQLSHNLKQYHLSYHKAIENLQDKLHHKGLTAFDKNNIENNTNKSRKLAVKACIEMTLELLTKSLSDKIKRLILYTGIGTSLQTAVLCKLWKISQQEAKDIVDVLWAYGLIQFTGIALSSINNITQHCVEVHAVISQYIIDNMDSNELYTLSPSGKVNTVQSVATGLSEAFAQSYGVHDPSLLTPIEYLNYKLCEIEKIRLPFYFKEINMWTVTDPHLIIVVLQQIMASQHTVHLLPLMHEEINSLIANCKLVLKDAHKLCRKLNQSIQRNFYEKNYNKLFQTIEEFIKNYPVGNITQKAATMVKNVMPYCSGRQFQYMRMKHEYLQMRTTDYHSVKILILPYIKLNIEQHKKIISSLQNGSPDIEITHHYFMSGQYHKDCELVKMNRAIKLKEVAPRIVQLAMSLKAMK